MKRITKRIVSMYRLMRAFDNGHFQAIWKAIAHVMFGRKAYLHSSHW